jgi:hypothetical protein
MAFGSPPQFGNHKGINIDSTIGNSFAAADKLQKILTQAMHLIGRAEKK